MLVSVQILSDRQGGGMTASDKLLFPDYTVWPVHRFVDTCIDSRCGATTHRWPEACHTHYRICLGFRSCHFQWSTRVTLKIRYKNIITLTVPARLFCRIKHCQYCVRLEVLTAVLLMTQVFGYVTLCHWMSGSQHLEGLWHLHLQGSGSTRRKLALEDEGSTVLQNTEATQPVTQHHMSYDLSLLLILTLILNPITEHDTDAFRSFQYSQPLSPRFILILSVSCFYVYSHPCRMPIKTVLFMCVFVSTTHHNNHLVYESWY
jgi:hypothetical protein